MTRIEYLLLQQLINKFVELLQRTNNKLSFKLNVYELNNKTQFDYPFTGHFEKRYKSLNQCIKFKIIFERHFEKGARKILFFWNYLIKI